MQSDPPSNAQCIACNRPNTAEPKMVQCDGCNRWYHFSCAGVGDSIAAEDRSYKCALCRPPSRAASSVRTTSTTASAREARLRLEMQRLEEEKKLEKEFLDRKFKLLQAQLDDDSKSSRASAVSVHRSTASNDDVQHWIDSHQANLTTTTGNVAPTGVTSQTGGAIVSTVPISDGNTTLSSSKITPVTIVTSQEAQPHQEATISKPLDHVISPTKPGGVSKSFDNVISPINTGQAAGFHRVSNWRVAPHAPFQSTPVSLNMPVVKTTTPAPWQPNINPLVSSFINQPTTAIASSHHIPASVPCTAPGSSLNVRFMPEDPRVGQYHPYVLPGSSVVSTANLDSLGRNAVDSTSRTYVHQAQTFPLSTQHIGYQPLPGSESQLCSSEIVDNNSLPCYSNPLMPLVSQNAVPSRIRIQG